MHQTYSKIQISLNLVLAFACVAFLHSSQHNNFSCTRAVTACMLDVIVDTRAAIIVASLLELDGDWLLGMAIQRLRSHQVELPVMFLRRLHHWSTER
jgi:hypothetical protein